MRAIHQALGSAILLVVALAGCQAWQPEPRLDSPLYPVPEGSTLVLNRPVTIGPNEVSTYIQGGRVMPYSRVDRYYPYCKFELWQMQSVSREVDPDTFVVREVERDWYLVRNPLPVQVASVSVGGDDEGGGPAFRVSSTIMRLHSPRQPDVFRMTCEHWEDVTDARHLTIEQVRGALGEVFTLRLPPKVQSTLP